MEKQLSPSEFLQFTQRMLQEYLLKHFPYSHRKECTSDKMRKVLLDAVANFEQLYCEELKSYVVKHITVACDPSDPSLIHITIPDVWEV